MNQFRSTPLILVRPKEDSPITLYLEVSKKDVNLVLAQDNDGDEMPVFFVIKVFKGAEICYQKIKQLALEVVIISMKLKQYFQGHPIIVKTNYPIKRIWQEG